MGSLKRWKEGTVLQAAVLGFLPGKRVLLDVQGETCIAWSDLPLVRGRLIPVLVEREGEGTRLRVVGEEEETRRFGWGDEKSPAGGRPDPADDLDRLIARSARRSGVTLTGPSRETVRKEAIDLLHRRFPEGIVPMDEWERTVGAVLIARAKGIEPSRRARSSIVLDHETRIGTALARLIEALGEIDRSSGGRRGALDDWARRLRSFYLPLDRVPLPIDLDEAILRCGYRHEGRLAEKGLATWPDEESGAAPSPPGGGEDDLKGALLELRRSLARPVIRGRRRQEEGGERRGREKASAWCGRLLDTIEAIQVQNLDGGAGATSRAFQLPIVVSERAGTLHLFTSPGKSQFWVDLRGLETVGGELMEREEGRFLLDLFLPEGLLGLAEPIRRAVAREGRAVDVRAATSPSVVALSASAPERKKVDLVL